MKTIRKFFLLIVFVFITSASLTAQTIISVNPNNAQQGQSLPVAITGTNSSLAQGSCTIGPGYITSVTPDHARQGQTLTVTITGFNTDFNQGSLCLAQGSTTITDVWISQGSSTIDGCWWDFYSNLFFAIFGIPEDANTGKWDVHVNTFCDEIEELTLSDGFTITPPCPQPGDLTCDGIVDFFDIAVVADNWLEGTGP